MRRLLAPILAAGTLNAASFVVDGNLGAAFAALVATVVITLAVVRWIDDRITHKIKNYSTIVKWQHRTILREISGLRELMGHPALDVDGILASEKTEAG